ncbi:MAG: DNA repair protein RecO [Desulfobacterales bacterium]|nr:DNA repair protein RecO [Desulfobacterales bacterium]
MSLVNTPAIMLRRKDYGDYDVIVTLFTKVAGKVTTIAKAAKKSSKRFAGTLELFSVLQIVYRKNRRGGLAVLQEASLQQPFANIRSSIIKTAYASYWAELINEWLESGQAQPRLYRLFHDALWLLDTDDMPAAGVSIILQTQFAQTTGFEPNLVGCQRCKTKTDFLTENQVMFDIVSGSLVCDRCNAGLSSEIYLSKGTIKQLQWVASGDMAKAQRIRFTPQALKEGLTFVERFLPYHLGKSFKSLAFLRKMRNTTVEG